MTEEVSKKRKWGWFLGVGAFLGLLVIGGIYLCIQQQEKYVSTNDAFIDSYRIDLSPDILARVVELKVEEGDYVKQGDVIAILQPDIFLAQKIEAEAALASSIKHSSFQKVHLEKVQNDYIRANKGIQDQIISLQEFDHFKKNYEMAEASYNKALADIVVAESKIQLINTYLNHTIIYAPFNGVIAKRWIFTGDVIRPGQTIFTMYDHERVWIQANVSEKKIKKVRLDDPVEIFVDAYPNKAFYGKVFTIQSAAASQFSVIPQNNATGNYTKIAQRIPIKITLNPAFSERELYLFPGMSGEVKIKIQGN